MRKMFGTCFLLLGIFCLTGAAGLFLYNQHENNQAEIMTERLLPELEEAIETQKNDSLPETDSTKTDNAESGVTIDGRTYLGYLSIPALDLSLPVLRDWNFDSLKIAPCRYFGSLEEGGLVIAAHNYKRHFGLLSSLEPGDTIRLTDTDGIVHHYEVREVTVLQPEDVDEMISGSWDLTLFTCTYGGKSRVTIRCISTPQSQE